MRNLIIVILIINILNGTCLDDITKQKSKVEDMIEQPFSDTLLKSAIVDLSYDQFYLEGELNSSLINDYFNGLSNEFLPQHTTIGDFKLKQEMVKKIFSSDKSVDSTTAIEGKFEVKIKREINPNNINFDLSEASFNFNNDPKIILEGDLKDGITFAMEDFNSKLSTNTLFSNFDSDLQTATKITASVVYKFPSEGVKVNFSLGLEIEPLDLASLVASQGKINGSANFSFDKLAVTIPADFFNIKNILIDDLSGLNILSVANLSNTNQLLKNTLLNITNNIIIKNLNVTFTNYDNNTIKYKYKPSFEISVSPLAPKSGVEKKGLASALGSLSMYDKYSIYIKTQYEAILSQSKNELMSGSTSNIESTKLVPFELGIKQPTSVSTTIKHSLVKYKDGKTDTAEVSSLLDIIINALESQIVQSMSIENSLNYIELQTKECLDDVTQYIPIVNKIDWDGFYSTLPYVKEFEIIRNYFYDTLSKFDREVNKVNRYLGRLL